MTCPVTGPYEKEPRVEPRQGSPHARASHIAPAKKTVDTQHWWEGAFLGFLDDSDEQLGLELSNALTQTPHGQ